MLNHFKIKILKQKDGCIYSYCLFYATLELILNTSFQLYFQFESSIEMKYLKWRKFYMQRTNIAAWCS